MKIQLIDPGTPASVESIHALERAIGRPISERVRRFLSHNDGARPEPRAFFRVGLHNSSGVNRFIPISEILNERALLDHLPESAYPITHDGCGNYAIVDEGKHGAVFFWDHEEPDNRFKVADNFDEFLDSLEVYAVNPETLSAARASTGWIDPRFVHLTKKKK